MRRPKRGDLVIVEWRDSCHYGQGWHRRASVRRFAPAKVTSVGFVAKAGKRRIVLVGNIARNTDRPCSNVTVIPWGCVRSVSNLEER